MAGPDRRFPYGGHFDKVFFEYWNNLELHGFNFGDIFLSKSS